MRKFLTGVALAAVAATPAFAQDVADAPFTGPHVEVLGGYDNISKDDAFAYGVGAGFDIQAGPAILGVEGEFVESTQREVANNLVNVGDRFKSSSGRDLYAGLRVGFAASPTTLVYAKGGYTNLRLNNRYNDGTGNTSKDGVNVDGYRLGAGVEQKFSLFGPSGFAKAEYRYSNYQEAQVAGPNVDIDVDRHQIMLGAGIRF